MTTIALIILEQLCMYLPLIIGGYIAFSLLKVPNISIESAYVFGSILAANFMFVGQSVPFVIYLPMVFVVSFFGGMMVGLVTALLTQYCRVPHLLSSILTIGIFHGINQAVLGNAHRSLSGLRNPLVVSEQFIKNPELIMLLVVGLLLMAGLFFLLRTQLGYSFAVFGYNPRFFEHYGIATNFVVLSGIALANGLAGISGYLVAQSSGFVDTNAGFGMALFCITALILGKSLCFFVQSFSWLVPLIGAVVYCSLQQLLLKVGFNLKYFTMIQSLLVLLMVIQRYQTSRSNKNVNDLGV
ncbi:hypothetical protein IPF37_02770 [bacterium]|nr:MAG: hypothetical protein IPF37_02770 [bacterium]